MSIDGPSLFVRGIAGHFALRSVRGRFLRGLAIALVLSVTVKSAIAGETIPPSYHSLDCGYKSPEHVQAALRAAVLAGEIQDPAAKPLPMVAPRRRPPDASRGGSASTVIPADIFPFETEDSE